MERLALKNLEKTRQIRNVVTSGTSWFIPNQLSSLMRGRDGLWEDLSACEELWVGVREENFPITLSSKVRLYFVNLPT